MRKHFRTRYHGDRGIIARNVLTDFHIHSHYYTEVDYPLMSRLHEMQFHRHHIRPFKEITRMNHSTIHRSLILVHGKSGGNNLTTGHVISIELDSIHVGNNSLHILHLNLHGSHVRKAGEGTTDVLSSNSLDGWVTRIYSLPGTIIKSSFLPNARILRRVLPRIRG